MYLASGVSMHTYSVTIVEHQLVHAAGAFEMDAAVKKEKLRIIMPKGEWEDLEQVLSTLSEQGKVLEGMVRAPGVIVLHREALYRPNFGRTYHQ